MAPEIQEAREAPKKPEKKYIDHRWEDVRRLQDEVRERLRGQGLGDMLLDEIAAGPMCEVTNDGYVPSWSRNGGTNAAPEPPPTALGGGESRHTWRTAVPEPPTYRATPPVHVPVLIGGPCAGAETHESRTSRMDNILVRRSEPIPSHRYDDYEMFSDMAEEQHHYRLIDLNVNGMRLTAYIYPSIGADVHAIFEELIRGYNPRR